MAQLVKIYDCISRYEWNPYRYPTQFIRLKQENWKTLYRLWQETPQAIEEQPTEQGKKRRFFQWNGFFKKEDDTPEEEVDIHHLSELELRAYFLEKLFPVQMKWATSTVSDVSFIDQEAYEDDRLAYFLQRFPDIYFIMYYPLFQIKDTPFDGEIIMVGPTDIEIIYILEKEPGAMIYADDDRMWTVDNHGDQSKILNPALSLKRNEHVIQGLLQARGVELPIKKTVLAKDHLIISNRAPYKTELIGLHEYDAWFKAKRAIQSPLKHGQLQALETLLMYCASNSVRRPAWEAEEPQSFEDEENK